MDKTQPKPRSFQWLPPRPAGGPRRRFGRRLDQRMGSGESAARYVAPPRHGGVVASTRGQGWSAPAFRKPVMRYGKPVRPVASPSWPAMVQGADVGKILNPQSGYHYRNQIH